MKSTTARSLEHLRKEGYYAEVVERYNTFSRRKNDLFGFADILAVHRETGDVLLVQTTSLSNISSRMNKIAESENLPLVRKAGMGIHVHGWKKQANGRYNLRIEDVS